MTERHAASTKVASEVETGEPDRPPVRQPHFVTFAAFPLVKAVYLLKS